MKYFSRLASLATVFCALNVHAQTSYWSCSNGTIDQVGDRYYQIDLLEDGVEFMPYEAGFSVDADDISYSNGVYTITNKKVLASAEGEEFTSRINASLIFNKKAKSLNAAISTDGGPFQAYEMTCVQK